MNIEAHTLDSLRQMVRSLQRENKTLKEQLLKANIPFQKENLFVNKIEDHVEYDPDQGERIISRYIDEDLARSFFRMFWGRSDVYAKRGTKGGYFPQCDYRWITSICPKQQGVKIACEACEKTQWKKISVDTVIAHLKGERSDCADVIGVYPLFPDGTCRFLVFDFDNHEKDADQRDYANDNEDWHEEVDALRKICEMNGVVPLVERSRSGRGAHVWIFFKYPVSASLARNFGFLLLDKGSSSINLKTFHYYDRMYPSQDSASSLGNLIALPLQGRALKEGNSAFVDQNWNAYPDQWDILLNHTPKLDIVEIELLMKKWQGELAESKDLEADIQNSFRPKPWKKNISFNKNDVVGKMHLVLGDGIYVDALNLMPQIQNQIRSLAAFDNPIYYKNKRLGYSNYNNYSAIYLGKEEDGYIWIPRGLQDKLESMLKEAGIQYEIEDQRGRGKPIRVSFHGSLREKQDLAADTLLKHDHGILSAATAFGKTVVCSYLIAKRKVSTLILLQSKDLLEQWVDELNRFLTIDEDPPTYYTKTGRVKKRKDVIGVLHGGKNTLTGIVDVAMVGSIYSKGEFNEMIDSYGMVIMDECHHCGSTTSIEVMKRINARYVYGVSATPQRSDNLEKIIYMLLGPIRHSYSAKQRAADQGIGHYVYPRYTRMVDMNLENNGINELYALISSSTSRNNMILDDIRICVKNGRTPVVLTRYKEQANYLYENLSKDADHVFILYGDNSDKENSAVRQKLKTIPRSESLILVATGQKIGEGFDFPRLDTLMLTAPVSHSGRLEQYIGRLNRDYEGKTEVVVYDYIDSHIRTFDNMYSKRLRTYKRTGYQVISNHTLSKQTPNAIYDSGNYFDIFERDLIEAEKRIIISSPELTKEKISRFTYLVKARQEAGCKVTVLATDPMNSTYYSMEYGNELINALKECDIQVILCEEILEHFAIIDNDLVWHGGMNLLGKEDIWDNLMRIHSSEVADELLEIVSEKSK